MAESTQNNTLKVLSLLKKELWPQFEDLAKHWERYFNVKQTLDLPQNIAKYTNANFGVLFMDADEYERFNVGYYPQWQSKNQHFLYVVVGNCPTDKAIGIYKALADQILYLNQPEELLIWNSIAILRRFWNYSSNGTTVIYKEIIMDFMEKVFLLNQKEIFLTPKEFEVMKYLVQHRKEWVKKLDIYKSVWKADDDYSRNLDQVLQKLRNKIGDKYFEKRKGIGVKFE